MVVVQRPFSKKLDDAQARRLREQICGLTIELVPTASLTANPQNAKRHPERQIFSLAENMSKFGFHHPLLIDENGMIIGGHARLAAARLLKLDSVPAIRFGHLTAAQKRAVALADNKLAELGTWDADVLSLELTELLAEASELDFDVSITGFDTADIDLHILGGDGVSPGKPDPADNVPAPANAETPITSRGDVWVCGPHRLYCGSALDATSYRTLLGGAPVNMVFTAPPLLSTGVADEYRRVDARESAMTARELSSQDFVETICSRIADNVVDGAVVFIGADWPHLDEWSAAARPFFGTAKDLVVWVTDVRRGSFYRTEHQLIVVYVAGNASPTKNFGLGKSGRYRTNLWKYPRVNQPSRGRTVTSDLRSTDKPVALVVDAIRDCSKRGGMVLDTFAGSGTTMIAAERTGRLARLIDIDPSHCDLIVRRWQQFTKKDAYLAETNETFAQAKARRVSA
jgi:hypothetical protein